MAKAGRLVKEGSVQEITTRLSERPNFFITGINRLTAPNADLLRRQLFGSKARLLVVKRKLGQRAVQGLTLAGLQDLLEGSIGLVLAEADLLATAKLLVDFRKTHEEQLTVRGAVIDGQLLDAGRVEQLAQLPPKPVLLAQVVATIEAPIADVIFTLERLIGDIAWLAEQAAAQKPVDTAPVAPAAAPSPESPESSPSQTHTEPPKPQEGTSP